MKKLALLAAALAAAAGLAARLRQRSAGLDESSPLASWTAARIVRIELSRGGRDLALEKRAGRWSLVKPMKDWADQSAAQDVASAFEKLTLGAPVSDDPADASAYGLDAAGTTRVSVYVEGVAAPVVDGSLGAAAIANSALYFRGERETAVRLATGLPGVPSVDPDDYRERLLFPGSRGKLGAMRIVDFVDAASAAGLDHPVLTLGPEGEPPATWTFGALKRERDGRPSELRYARCAQRGVTALVSDFDVEPLLRRK